MLKKELPTAFAPAWLVLILVATAVLTPLLGNGQSDTRAGGRYAADPVAAAPVMDGQYAAAILMDAQTGQILAAHNPRDRRQPASMVKMMTELIVLERVVEGDLGLADVVTVSARASKMGGSQVYLKQGETFSVEDLLLALAVHSANDAAMALAEHVAGSKEAFVDLMNARCTELGMQDTEFHSVHGLPPGSGQLPDLSTAYDLALIGRELMKHPEAVRWASTSTAPFRGGEFILYNPNKLVGKYRGLDGIKTGFHTQAGYCVTASAVQKGKRLISVVMGAPTDQARATETTRLLSYGFNLFTQVTLIEGEKQPLPEKLKVKGGKGKKVLVGYLGPLTVSVPKDRVQEIILKPDLPENYPAPLEMGEVVGRGVALLDGNILGEVPIVALEEMPKGSWWDRLFN
jgi:D-alanyl-D-alanine carboxypeptidase (penicillin-binding protein 5/6)